MPKKWLLTRITCFKLLFLLVDELIPIFILFAKRQVNSFPADIKILERVMPLSSICVSAVTCCDA